MDDVKTEQKPDLDFIRHIAYDAMWGVLYHEKFLRIAYREVASIRKAMQQGGFEQIETEYDDNENPIFETLEQFIASILNDKLESVDYHEKELQKAHNKMGFVNIMLARGNYSETEINLDEITALAKKRLES